MIDDSRCFPVASLAKKVMTLRFRSVNARMCGFVSVLCLLPLASPSVAVDLLPDLIAWEHDVSVDGTPPNQDIMHGGFTDTTTIANRVLYRFRVAITNIGEGPLQVIEETEEVGGVKTTQTITQQVLQAGTGGLFRDLEIGTFPYPPEVPNGFGHLRLPGLAQYNLYETVDSGGGTPDVGALAATNDKLSMGIVDSIPYNQPVSGMPINRFYESSNEETLGISIGWADLYGAGLPGQFIDITDLASGQYWLEVVIDPYGRILELDDSNNTTRILVDIAVPSPQIYPGDYNDDGLVDLADYTVWRDTLGTEVARGTGADGDGDGVVQAADYTVWKARFAEVANSSAAASQVPEPATWACSIVMLMALRRRWQ